LIVEKISGEKWADYVQQSIFDPQRRGGGAVGETVRFVEENGKVVSMYTCGSFSDRVN